jgi:hypothetical protein
MSRIEIGIEIDGQVEGQDSRSPRTGGRLLRGQCCLVAETVADRLGQSRLIHLPFHAGNNLSFILDLAFLFHEVVFL